MNLEQRAASDLSAIPYAMGVLCGAAAFVFWAIYLFFNPYRAPDAQGAIIPLAMSVLVICGVGAALLRAPWGMLAFGLATLPISLYMLGTPGIFKYIGVATVGFLAATVWALAARRHTITS